jgi:hypothetical protein
MNRASINYDKNDYENANKPIKKDDIQIYDSIFEAFKNDFDMSLLKGYGKQNLSPAEKSFLNLILRTGRASKKMEGGISKKSFYKAIRVSAPIAKKIAATTVKVGLPAVAALVAPELGIPPPLAVGITKIAANKLAEKIGGIKNIFKPVKMTKMEGGITDEKKKKIAKDLIKTFGATALAAGTAYTLKKVHEYLDEKYGVDSKELIGAIFELARILITETVRHNVSTGAGCCNDDDNVGHLAVTGSGYKDTVLGKRDRQLHDTLAKALSPHGSGYKDTVLGKRDRQLHDALVKVLQEHHMSGGKFDAKSFSKKALEKSLKVGSKIAPIVAKKGIPLVTKEVGETLGLPAPVTKVIGQTLGELASKKLSGKGQKRINDDIAEYKGGAKPSGRSRQKDRAAKVREIMRERGVSLPEASKIIKSENISY